ncbi:TniQ family protein [uncultured Sphingomonas sp.]|uniref:TniQ family protein n=1 Tax=uncultured Sphingomonas sp. TaxID=158754 RepID=UPI0035CBA63C
MTIDSLAPAPARVPSLPTLYEDELLYRLVARYDFMTGYPRAASANLDLFASEASQAASRLPTGLAALAARLPAHLDLTGDDLARRHTLLPYQCAFLPQEAKERAFSQALADGRKRGRPVCGVQKPLPSPTRLRFCPDCIHQMTKDNQDLH